ncbi:unnamed protein product [Brachionus calyciflorus]|uniref:Uncharacterized protein n=1 Tax=Brachionus calyciflorus TaxID=104777 RepID=A0A814D8X6_9BILA|nr:unnamed protein product [Brachionus calyciflorus]
MRSDFECQVQIKDSLLKKSLEENNETKREIIQKSSRLEEIESINEEYRKQMYEEEIKNLKNKLNEEKEKYNKGIENLKYDSEKKDAKILKNNSDSNKKIKEYEKKISELKKKINSLINLNTVYTILKKLKILFSEKLNEKIRNENEIDKSFALQIQNDPEEIKKKRQNEIQILSELLEREKEQHELNIKQAMI